MKEDKNIVMKLSQNENPMGSSPKAMQEICKNAHLFSVYPEPHSLSLKNEIAKKLKRLPESIFVCAGLIETLDILIRNFVNENENILVSECSFVAYRLLAKVFKKNIRFAKMNNYHLSANGILESYNAQTKLIIIDNPNNPTGTILNQTDIERILSTVASDVLVVLDEAYYEYVSAKEYPNSIALLDKYKNLIVMRSFSKIHGLAGLRVGYCIASPKLITEIELFQAPFTVNQAASTGATAAINDDAFVTNSYNLNLSEREKLSIEISASGYKVIASQSNFILIIFSNSQDRDDLDLYLIENNIFVRKTEPFGANNGLRISVGLPEQNSKVLKCIKDYSNISQNKNI